ncbi:MAG: M56 family metallopeptidase [Pseudomonadota bacterium]
MIETLIACQVAVAVALLMVLAIRRPLRKLAGPQLTFGVWLLPIIAPLAVTLPGPFIPPTDPVRAMETEPTVVREVTAAGGVVDVAPADAPVMTASESTGRPSLSELLLLTWCVGAGLTLLVLVARQRRFDTALAPLVAAPELGQDVYRTRFDRAGPLLVGALRPRIVVPHDFEARFNAVERELVLDHERQHRRAGHAQFNALAALAQVLCWFNPLIYLAQSRFRLDQELACDAAVMKRRPDARAYGHALLRAQTHLSGPLLCSWTNLRSLQTRVVALGAAAPGVGRRAVGRLALVGLCLSVATAAWSARPEVRAPQAGVGPLTSTPTGDVFDASRLVIDGLTAHVNLVVEDRGTVQIDGHRADNIRVEVRNDTLFVEALDDRTRCSASDAPSTELTLRVPRDMRVNAAGQVDVTVTTFVGADLDLEGCGEIHFGELQEAVTLRLYGDFDVHGEHVTGAFTAVTSGSPSIRIEHVAGGLQLNGSGGSDFVFEDVSVGGTVQLSGGSTVQADAWLGDLDASVSGGSRLAVDRVRAGNAVLIAGGASEIGIEGGQINSLHIDQAANAEIRFLGEAVNTVVRNRGALPVSLADAGAIDARGRVSVKTPTGGTD